MAIHESLAKAHLFLRWPSLAKGKRIWLLHLLALISGVSLIKMEASSSCHIPHVPGWPIYTHGHKFNSIRSHDTCVIKRVSSGSQ